MLTDYYLTLKSLHLLSIIAWMAGLLYLPRLYIYHLEFEAGSTPYTTFCIMERRTLKIILLPAIFFSFLFGGLLAFSASVWSAPWFHVKILLVLCLAGFHGYLAHIAKTFARGERPSLSRKALCLMNELPFLFAIFIVFLAVWKPF